MIIGSQQPIQEWGSQAPVGCFSAPLSGPRATGVPKSKKNVTTLSGMVLGRQTMAFGTPKASFLVAKVLHAPEWQCPGRAPLRVRGIFGLAVWPLVVRWLWEISHLWEKIAPKGCGARGVGFFLVEGWSGEWACLLPWGHKVLSCVCVCVCVGVSVCVCV